jgi:hypothetical protein
MIAHLPDVPFGLSLSKACFPFSAPKKEQGFDKLSSNGVYGVEP